MQAFKAMSKQIISKLEAISRHWLVDKNPVRLPESLQQLLVEFLPWLVIIVLLVILPWVLLMVIFGILVGVAGASAASIFRFRYYLSVVVLLIETLILLKATPRLRKQQLAGWRLIFVAVWINLAYGLIRWFTEPSAIFSLIWTLVLSGGGLYLLSQLRNYYR